MKVWFVLYKEGTNEQISKGPASVTVDDGADIDDLRKAIKVELGDDIQCSASLLAVHQHGAAKPMDTWITIPEGSTGKHPFIVTAPVRDPPSSPASSAINVEALELMAMSLFFETNLKSLTLNGRWMENIHTMTWTKARVTSMYWRKCYSYLLCTTVAALETAFEARRNSEANKQQYIVTESFVLTGTQGTGKSVLGAFIALTLHQIFRWNVTYHFGSTTNHFSYPDSKKHVLIWDASVGLKRPSIAYDFLLLVTSSNEKAWHQISQQGNWTVPKGNYIWIDPCTKQEIEAMATKAGATDWSANFEMVGGVARLCTDAAKNVKDMITTATTHFLALSNVKDCIQSLQSNMDEAVGVPGKKIYPGLIAHFTPTNPFRNAFSLTIASEYVKSRLSDIVMKEDDTKVEELLQDLLPFKKARSFAGNIWEPFFSKRMTRRREKLVVVGCKLPANEVSEASVLLELDLADISSFSFKDIEDLKSQFKQLKLQFKQLKQKQGDSAWIFAKAEHDNFATIDAVLFKVSSTEPRVIGLQLTVAAAIHYVNETGILHLAELCDLFEPTVNCNAELWFLEPEACLHSNFGFTSLQAIIGKATNSQSNKKRKTNNPDCWDPAVRAVEQFIAIAVFVNASEVGIQTKHACAVREKLVEALGRACDPATRNQVDTVVDEPTLRTWISTVNISCQLAQCNKEFGSMVLEDLEEDKQRLRDEFNYDVDKSHEVGD